MVVVIVVVILPIHQCLIRMLPDIINKVDLLIQSKQASPWQHHHRNSYPAHRSFFLGEKQAQTISSFQKSFEEDRDRQSEWRFTRHT